MKKSIAFLVILSLVVLSGCGQNPDGKPVDDPAAQTNSLSNPFLGGTEAIHLSFIGGAPPPYIFDAGGYDFTTSIRIINVGESSIDKTKSYIQLTGFNPTDFGTSSAGLKKFVNLDLRGAKKNFDGTQLPGDEDVLDFGPLRYVPDLKGNTNFKIRADMCYVYKTYATGKICIKRDLLDDLDDVKICKVNEKKEIYNSGGPVWVEELEEHPMGTDRVQVKFLISHKGKDLNKIFNKDSPECIDNVANPEKDKVYVKVTSDIAGRKPSCQGFINPGPDNSEGFVKLWTDAAGTPQSAPVTCILDVHDQTSIYEDLFELELEYRYQESISTPIEVKDVSTNRP